MAHYFKALTLALFLCITNANAAYTQANPPAGWSGGTGPGGFWDTSSRNTVSFSSNGKVLIKNATVNLGGRSVALNAALKLSENAPKVAAATLFSNPGLAAGIRVAGWLATAGLIYNSSKGLWEGDSDLPEGSYPSDGFMYCSTAYNCESQGNPKTKELAALAFLKLYLRVGTSSGWTILKINSIICSEVSCSINYDAKNNWSGSLNLGHTVDTAIVKKGVSPCSPGEYVLPSGECTDNIKRVFDETRFIEEVTKYPMPHEVPQEIPARYPVGQPEIEPVFSPSGNPKPNPQYDPLKEPTQDNLPWIQQGEKLEPSPTIDQPWRVDVRPIDRPVPGPEPSPDDVIPEPKPDAPGDRPKDQEQPPDLCEKHPDILACQVVEMGEPEKPEALREIPKQATFQIEGGFNPGGSCPSFPSVGSLVGGQISWQPFCDSLSMIKPLVLAFAWFSAVFIILKYGRK